MPAWSSSSGSAAVAKPSLIVLTAFVACTPARREASGLSVWAEYLPKETIAARLAFAAEAHVAVNVAMKRGEHDRAYLRAVCAAADRNAVAIRLWPLLHERDGYWANQQNVDAYLAWVDELFAWADGDCPHLDGVVVDMEMPIDRVALLQEKRAAGENEIQIATFLHGERDDDAFERARDRFADAARRAHARGRRFSVSTLPMLVEDFADGDDGVQRALWTPITKIDWDAVSFQVYRSLFDTQFPSDLGGYTPGLITTYAQAISDVFGARGGIDLGSTGTGINLPRGLGSAEALQADIAAALAAGITIDHVAVYSLEGLEDKADALEWLAVPSPVAAEIAAPDEFPRAVFRLFDALDE